MKEDMFSLEITSPVISVVLQYIRLHEGTEKLLDEVRHVCKLKCRLIIFFVKCARRLMRR